MTPRRPRIGSICSGYGGLDLAAEQVFGGAVAWHAETDPTCRAVLAHHWPNTPNLGDITQVDWLDVPEVDVIVAGPPCTPYSLAGKRRGVDDPRHLWPHIAAAVGVLRPDVLLLENVPGFVTLGLPDALAALALYGYVCRWDIVAAAEVGACHLRRRFFLLATHTPRVGGRAAADPTQPLPARWATRPLPGGGDRRTHPVIAPLAPYAPGLRRSEGIPEPVLQQRTHPGRHRRQGPPPTDSQSQRHRNPGAQGRHRLPSTPVPGPAPDHLAADDADRLGTAVPDIDWGEYEAAIRRWEQVLGHRAPHPADEHRRLRPEFVAWMMGCPAHFSEVSGLSRANQLKALGNGAVVQQTVAALSRLAQMRCPDDAISAE
ncbi:DNA cytosine methyltransferase [Streptacidiphilus albus]|uniref:DNA cytosine methyltransferase n=1 Tax=Streptacidiphilus albus TaxID=105425 RepID=UPI00054BFCC7|nr:DNA cytosine methyltransferase [Streptacidiphilus albus]